jgi:hypothetical protein
MIFQPVTAFNYYEHSSLSGTDRYNDTAIINRWTGASWICPPDNKYCTRSDPVLSFSQGELAYGGIFWYEAPDLKWLIYLVNGNNQGTWRFSDQYNYTQPSRVVIAYEFGGSYPLGQMPYDDQKITSTTFSDISVWDTNGNQISSLHWNGVVNSKDHTKTTGLNVDLSQAPSTVTLNTSDHRTKIGIFRPSTHKFTLDFNGNGIWEGAEIDREYDFGTTGDIPITGDWDGNGITEVGVFRPSTHTFYLRNAGYPGVPATTINWGISTDLPVAGDWDGNGMTEVGVFRPSTHTFYLRNAGYPSVPPTVINWGSSTDLPVTGDWDGGNGMTEVGVFRPSTHTFYLRNAGYPGVPTTTINWGISTDLPVTGDWDGGNGMTEVGVFRPSTHTFYLRNAGYPGVPTTTINWGLSTDLPVTGTWA